MRNSTSRAFFPKRCSPPTASWLESFEKIFFSGRKIELFEAHFFDNFLIVVISSDNNCSAIKYTSLYNKRYLRYIIGNLVNILHFSFRKRCPFSVPNWLGGKSYPADFEK